MRAFIDGIAVAIGAAFNRARLCEPTHLYTNSHPEKVDLFNDCFALATRFQNNLGL